MLIDINTLDDVLPHIRENSGIIVSTRPDHTVIDYVFTTDETFDSHMALQCRGLKFDGDGRLIARPLHKFFNIGEREDPNRMDWSRPHHILDKLDGTMVHAVVLNGEMMLMTRMGRMKQAQDAYSLVTDGILGLCHEQISTGFTPIFEYTAPENRIVVEYSTPALTLLAVREMVSGRYIPDTEMRRLGLRYAVPVTPRLGSIADIKSFMKDTRELADIEGYVIAFDDGHRVKIKTDGYVLRHRALGDVHLEKNVLAWIVRDAVDDVVPLLSADVSDHVLAYQRDVQEAVSRRVDQAKSFYDEFGRLDRKEFAQAVQQTLDKSLRAVAFAMKDGREPRAQVIKHLVWASESQTRIDEIREIYGFSWSTEGLQEPQRN